jgi:hypothetical protein
MTTQLRTKVGHFHHRRGSEDRRPKKTPATADASGKNGHSYRPLPTEFRHNGFNYRQITRTDNAAIYQQKWCGCSNPSVAYEVIRIRRRDGFYIAGRFVEPAEVYPNSEAWGVDGFTLRDAEAALTKLKEVRAW